MASAKKQKVTANLGYNFAGLNGYVNEELGGFVIWSWGSTLADLFTLCPKEVWCLILEQLGDSKDMLNVFKAFPGMEAIMKHKRRLWLFDQVIPNLAEWLSEGDLLTCRLVSKHWSRAVDNFLEHNPSLRAYDHESQVTGQVWGLSDYSKCFHGPMYRHHEYQFSRPYFQTSFVFNTPETFARFSTDMGDHSARRNQIVGRSVKLYPNDGDNNYATELQIKAFWESALAFLRNWGEHIWFISIRGCKEQTARDFFQTLVQALSLLPNLKSLEVNSGPRWISRRNFVSLRSTAFPNLPHLETLKLDFWFRTLSETMINRYGAQIRRLMLSPGWDWDWKPEYANLFPNLTELEISHTSNVKGRSWKERMNDVLLLLNSPRLYWLHLEIPQNGRMGVILSTDELCGWLRRFSGLAHLRLADLSGALTRMFQQAERSVTALKTLSMHDSAMSSKFLLSFPALECLEIRTRCNGSIIQHVDGVRHRQNPAMFFQEYIQNGSLANVWVLLTKLKILILLNDCRDIRDRFSRLKFEKYLRGMGSSEETHEQGISGGKEEGESSDDPDL